jgi:hypothetical protein
VKISVRNNNIFQSKVQDIWGALSRYMYVTRKNVCNIFQQTVQQFTHSTLLIGILFLRSTNCTTFFHLRYRLAGYLPYRGRNMFPSLSVFFYVLRGLTHRRAIATECRIMCLLWPTYFIRRVCLCLIITSSQVIISVNNNIYKNRGPKFTNESHSKSRF